MNRLCIIILSCLGFFMHGCIKDLDIVPPYFGDKPVVNAYLCADEGLVVHLTYSLNPVGRFYYDSISNLVISDAQVLFYENHHVLFALEYVGEGYYEIPDNIEFQPTPGHTYRIEIDSPKYGQAQSSEIVFPEAVQASLISFDNIGRAPFESYDRGRFRFQLDWLPQNPAFVVLEMHSEEEDFHFIFWEDAEFRYNFADACEAETPFGLVLSNLCGYSGQDTLSMVTYIQYNLRSEQGSSFSWETHFYTNMQLRIISVNEAYFDYVANMNYFLDDEVDAGLLFGASDPNIFMGNIEGGFGLFYARNSTSVTLPDIGSEEE